MIRAFRNCSIEIAAAMLVAFAVTTPASADSAGCNRARAIVQEAVTMYSSANVDHRAVLNKLKTAQQLCPTLGESWKYAHCSALALGDTASARVYKDRAIFNGVADLTCGAASGGVEEVAPLPSRVHEKYALIIGVGKFIDSGIPPLQYAAKDARDFRDVLLDPHYGNFSRKNVTLLTDEEATRDAILGALQDISQRAREDDLVVTYVSSHGLGRDAEGGLAGMGYIATHDMQRSKAYLNGLVYRAFIEQVGSLRARRKVVFLDTCYSGEASMKGSKALAIEGGGIDAKTAALFLSGEGTYIITSSDKHEQSWESDSIRNGYFTHYLVEALKHATEPQTVREIYEYLSGHLPAAVEKEKHASQHPQIYPETDAGDVRIGVIAEAAGNNRND
ncbi:MAG TPA: caspase family protein [Thermoanaerobaculia bacterium]|nr:caspase family protein [Thermoanaerobaculia bacterium]